MDVPEENSKLKELKTIDCVKKGLYYLSKYTNLKFQMKFFKTNKYLFLKFLRMFNE